MFNVGCASAAKCLNVGCAAAEHLSLYGIIEELFLCVSVDLMPLLILKYW